MKLKKNSWCTGLLLLIAIFAMTPLCSAATTAGSKTSLEDVKKESRDLIQALKGYSVAQRDEAIAKIKEALAHIDQRINALEITIGKNWDKMDKEAQEKTRASLAELRKERTVVAELSDSLKSGSVDAWEDIKKGFSDAYVDFNADLEKFESEFGAGK